MCGAWRGVHGGESCCTKTPLGSHRGRARGGAAGARCRNSCRTACLRRCCLASRVLPRGSGGKAFGGQHACTRLAGATGDAARPSPPQPLHRNPLPVGVLPSAVSSYGAAKGAVQTRNYHQQHQQQRGCSAWQAGAAHPTRCWGGGLPATPCCGRGRLGGRRRGACRWQSAGCRPCSSRRTRRRPRPAALPCCGCRSSPCRRAGRRRGRRRAAYRCRRNAPAACGRVRPGPQLRQHCRENGCLQCGRRGGRERGRPRRAAPQRRCQAPRPWSPAGRSCRRSRGYGVFIPHSGAAGQPHRLAAHFTIPTCCSSHSAAFPCSPASSSSPACSSRAACS